MICLFRLLDLIYSLDDFCSKESLSLPQPTLILTGRPDALTRIKHCRDLKKSMGKNCQIIEFTLGSHFLIFEWPDLVAKYFIQHLLNKNQTN